MLINNFEAALYQICSLLLAPTLIVIVLALLYSLYASGSLLLEAWLRRQGKQQWELTRYARDQNVASDDLELFIMKQLELLRLTSRCSPLFGLVATLIPMGPALLALSENDTASVGSNMVVAFSGVTLALIAAALSFIVVNIRRRWLFEELRAIERGRSAISSSGTAIPQGV